MLYFMSNVGGYIQDREKGTIVTIVHNCKHYSLLNCVNIWLKVRGYKIICSHHNWEIHSK